MIDLKIVKVRIAGSVVFSLRWADADGIECEVLATNSQEDCERMLKLISKLESGPIAMMLACSLITIVPLATLIRQTEDQQGTAGYATKSHMRAWAGEIFNSAKGALEFSGLKETIRAFPKGSD